MKSDAQLKADVSQELEWDPSIDASQVGVTAKDGVVTLSGHLRTYAEKLAAERAAMRVAGVKAVAVELDVQLAPGHVYSDTEIAQAIETALKWQAFVPTDRIKVKVERGWVTLSGEVDWDFQRVAAGKVVRPLRGVVGLDNRVTIKPQANPGNISQHIRQALARHAEREARDIVVTVNGSTVTLTGRVDSWAERNVARGAAWSAPGVTAVINDLTDGRG
jgi:osmotically-inducible protein OsmY